MPNKAKNAGTARRRGKSSKGMSKLLRPVTREEFSRAHALEMRGMRELVESPPSLDLDDVMRLMDEGGLDVVKRKAEEREREAYRRKHEVEILVGSLLHALKDKVEAAARNGETRLEFRLPAAPPTPAEKERVTALLEERLVGFDCCIRYLRPERDVVEKVSRAASQSTYPLFAHAAQEWICFRGWSIELDWGRRAEARASRRAAKERRA